MMICSLRPDVYAGYSFKLEGNTLVMIRQGELSIVS